MALPTETLTVIKNGRLIGDLDCNGFLLSNADPDSFPAGGGGGGGGIDTGTTTAILKGDGHHGIADAVPDTDYATPSTVGAALNLRETVISHNADVATINTHLTTIDGQVTTINTSLSGKADTATVNAALALKTNDTAFQAYVTSNNTAVAAKADTSAVNTALTAKADSSALTAGLATKENTLPTTANDAYVLARHNAGAGGAFYFVDPVTLGSTNASFSDGATHSNTTFNSTLAAFNNNDIGKTIVCAGNIPSGTTITAVSAPTCTLSAAATTTASPLTFTILNRFLAAGGGGTVTGVAVTNTAPPGGSNDLVTTTINNPTTSVEIVLSKPTTTPAKTFYGNKATTTGAASFMSQTEAFTALDVTTIGKAIAQQANPSADSFIKVISTSNTVQQRTPAQVASDIGAESVLSFNAPLSRATNTISMPAAAGNADGTGQVNGYLTGADHSAFAAKLSSARSISTTAPLTGGGTLANDLTIAMPAATGNSDGTGQANGYLTGVDHSEFKGKVPPTRSLTATAPLRISNNASPQVQVSGTFDLSANRALDMTRASATVDGYLAASDFAQFQAGSPSVQDITPGSTTSGTVTVTAPAAPAPPITRVIVSKLLTGLLTINLPPANLYTAAAGYPFLEIVDLAPTAAMTNFGIRLQAPSGVSIDGFSFIDLPRSLGYIRLNSDGTSKWTSTKYFVDSFRDPLNPVNRVNVAVASTPIPSGGLGAHTLTLPTVNSVAVIPNDGGDSAGNSFIYDYDGNGHALRAAPVAELPATSGNEGKVLTVVNSLPSWSGGSGASPYVQLAAASDPITWTTAVGQRVQNAYVTLPASRSLFINGLQSGMQFNLFVIQSTGGQTLTLPPGSLTPNNGLGFINPPLTATAGAIDLLQGEYVGSTSPGPAISYCWRLAGANLTGTAPSACNVAGAFGAVAPAATTFPINTLARTYTAVPFVCPAGQTSICKVEANLQAVGAPNFAIDCAIYTDAVNRTVGGTTGSTDGTSTIAITGGTLFNGNDVGQIITDSGGKIPANTYVGSFIDTKHVTLSSVKGAATPTVNAAVGSGLTFSVYGNPGVQVGGGSTNDPSSSSLPTLLNTGSPNANANPTVFTGITAGPLTAGLTYHIVLSFSPATQDASNYVNWLGTGTGGTGYIIKTSTDGSIGSWASAQVGRLARFATYHT